MTILFLDDWKKYPTAIVDVQTTNQSFVRLASLYREMGIKNHAFLLALINPKLQGVNPFDPNLTLETQLAIAYECKINAWYFFREILRVPPEVGSTAEVFQANRGNMALFWSFFNHIMIILIQVRQTGKSLSADGLMTYLLNIRCKGTEINLLTKDDTLRSRNIQRLKNIDEELPYYLKQRTKADVNNTEMLTVKSLGNNYKAHVPQKSPKMAYNVGRGLSSPIFQIDEPPFQPNIKISLSAALSAGTALREKAALNGEPYGTILTTTAGKKDDRDGKFIYEIVSDAAEWTERFFDCKDLNELEAMVRRHSRKGELVINATFNHKQLGKDDRWLKNAIEQSRSVGEDADRDFFNKWTSGTMSSPLPLATLEKIRNSYIPYKHSSISAIGGYLTRWYIDENQIEHRMKNGMFVMSLDTSDASGGDDISLVLTDMRSGEVIAASTFNETNLITFAQWLAIDWIVKYKNNLTTVIERKSSGVAIIDYLLLILPSMNVDPFKVLFNRAVNDYEEDPARFREVSEPMGRRSADVYTRHKKTFGFATSGSGMGSRSELYSTTLQSAAKMVGDKVRDLTTINQITGLVNLNGRVDHQSGEHDDLVIGWLLNHWLMTKAKNLDFYGIDSKQILCELQSIKIESNKDMYDYMEQQRIRQEIEKIYNEMKAENDAMIVDRLEQELRSLNRRLVLQDGEFFSVDDLIKSIRENKRKNPVSNNYGYQSSVEPYAHQHRDPRRFY